MGLIHVLSAHLANKIAAGEVIERPASVLKELVENSLDAGATRIDVAVDDGGRELIRVSDDGAGMDGDDLAMAVLPHATSKLADEDDLFALHTMGFRGEALPSIASVSQLRIVTRPKSGGADQGFAIEVAGGAIGPVTPAAASCGSVVEVRNLFFNTPARRKFLKADSTEIGHLGEALARIALSYTEVAFRMTHNGRLLYDLPATANLGQRVADFFGGELGNCLIPVELPPADAESPAIRGLIAPPQHSRPTAKWQYIFLNGRYIRDRFIQHAVREAYRGLMESSRQPVVFLYLLLPAELVDVNVHPTKIEVRFADSNRVHSAVLRCLRDRLTRSDLTVKGSASSGAPIATSSGTSIEVPSTVPQSLASSQDEEESVLDESDRQDRVRAAMAEFFKRNDQTQRPLAFPPSSPTTSGVSVSRNEESAPGSIAPASPFEDPKSAIRPSTSLGASTPKFLPPAVQIHNTYLVCQTDQGLIIVDQHALHERIIYQTLLARLTTAPGEQSDPAVPLASSQCLQSQRMLIPQHVTLGARQSALLFDHEDLLTRLGLELTRFGRDDVAINAFPTLLERIDPASFLRDLADKLADEPPATPEEFLHGVLDMMACKAAVKAGDPLTPAEIDALLAQRDLVDRSSNCPHGRPTTLTFSLADLEKQFHRR